MDDIKSRAPCSASTSGATSIPLRTTASTSAALHGSLSSMSFSSLANVCSHLQNASKARLGLTSVQLTKLHLAVLLNMQKQGFLSSLTIGGPRPPTPDKLLWSPFEDPGLPLELKEVVPDGSGAPRTKPDDTPLDSSASPTAAEPAKPPGQKRARKEKIKPVPGDNEYVTATRKQLGPHVFDLLHLHRSQHTFATPAAFSKRRSQQDSSTIVDDAATPLSARPLTAAALRALEVPINPAERRLWVGLKYLNDRPALSQMSLLSTPKKKRSLSLLQLYQVVRGRQANDIAGVRTPGECLFLKTDLGVLEARECVTRKVGGQALCRVC